MSKEELEAEFARIYGKPSWNVHKGYSSVLHMNFGQPRLNVHEPRTVKGKQTRITEIRGEWVLWIFGCDWKYFREDPLLGCSESSPEDIHRVAHDINGQALANVIFDNQAKAIFYFDLGGRLETTPFAENEGVIDQWVLFDPQGYATSFDSNGDIDRRLANQPIK
jgi:hypothetical protein